MIDHFFKLINFYKNLCTLQNLEESNNNASNEVEVFRKTKKQSLQAKRPRINSSNDNLKYNEHTNDNLSKEDFSGNVINEVINNLKEHRKVKFFLI